jgi:hypothetical protein
MAHNGSYIQVRDAQTSRLLGWMFVSQVSRKYDRLRCVASNPPRLASRRPEPGSERFFLIEMRFDMFDYDDGRGSLPCLVSSGWTAEDLMKTRQFIPTEF